MQAFVSPLIARRPELQGSASSFCAPISKNVTSRTLTLTQPCRIRRVHTVRYVPSCMAMSEAQDGGGGGGSGSESADNVTSVQQQEDAKLQNEEEQKLQGNQYYVFKEFGKISAVAVLIGIVLFFFDMVVSLMAITIGIVYGLAVLFEVPGADSLIENTVKSGKAVLSGIGKGFGEGWRTLRREVRKGLED